MGAIHGYQPGSWLVAAAVAPLLALGVPDGIAAQIVLLGVGLITAAVVAGVATTWTRTPRGAAVAAGTVGVVLAGGWPSWHHELSGLTGVTPESVPLQLAALLGALRPPAASRRAAAATGAAVALAALMSPASWWTAALVLGIWAARGPREGARSAAASVAACLAGGVLAVSLVAVLVPSGGEALAAFAGHAVGQVGHNVALVGAGPLDLLGGAARSPGAFVSDGAVAARWAAGLSGGLLLVGAGAILIAGIGGGLPDRTSLPLVIVACTFAVPLSRVAMQDEALLSAARYFVVPLALLLVAVAGEVGRAAERGPVAAGVAAVVIVAIAVPGTLGLSTALADRLAPPNSLAEGLLFAGAHSLRPRDGHAPEAAFVALLPHAPAEGREAYAQGYGMELGASLALADGEGRPAVPAWRTFDQGLDPAERRALLVGVGCGLVVAPPSDGTRAVLATLMPSEGAPISYGLGLCATSGKRRFGCDVTPLIPSGELRSAYERGLEEGRTRTSGVRPGHGAAVDFPPIERLRPQPGRTGC